MTPSPACHQSLRPSVTPQTLAPRGANLQERIVNADKRRGVFILAAAGAALIAAMIAKMVTGY